MDDEEITCGSHAAMKTVIKKKANQDKLGFSHTNSTPPHPQSSSKIKQPTINWLRLNSPMSGTQDKLRNQSMNTLQNCQHNKTSMSNFCSAQVIILKHYYHPTVMPFTFIEICYSSLSTSPETKTQRAHIPFLAEWYTNTLHNI